MLKNYFKIAVRNLRRQKLFSVINILGLAIGLASAIIIILFVTDEINFDKFNHNYNRIARLVVAKHSENKTIRYYSLTPGILGQELKAKYPEVEDYTTIIDQHTLGRFTVEYGENKYYESEYLITQPSFFKIFDYKILNGNKNKLLTEPNEMVLTESTAKKLFGNENPIGKTIKTDRQWGSFKVTGILKDPPLNSHLQFSMLISMKSLNTFPGFKKALNNFDLSIVRTYLLFQKGNNIQNFNSKLKEFQNANKAKSFGVTEDVTIQPLSDIHFNSRNIEFDLNANTKSKTTLYILGIIGLLIVLIAAINYTNLATAKSISRVKEIGIRKAVGANKNQLLQQFLMESILLTCIALGVSFLLVETMLSIFNDFTGKSLSLLNSHAAWQILISVFLTFLLGLLAGILPALLITKFKTVLILKGKLQTKNNFSFIGKTLVVVQFAISIILIFCTLTIYKQLKYVQTKNLGFNNDNLLVVDINSSGTRKNFQTLKNEFSKNPNVKSVTVSSRIPGEWKNLTEIKARNLGENELNNRKMFYIGADYDFINTFQIDIIEGRNFYQSYSEDSSNIIINNEAALALGVKNPIGKNVMISDGDLKGVYKIIGVVKDFNYQSLHEKISPIIIGFWNNPFISIDYFTARIGGKNIASTIKYLSKVQEHFDNITPFEYNFLDERMKDFYKQDEREATIINFSSGLALLIACLGLFGLAAFSAERRIKEIGIRKVLGSSVSGIVVLFSKEFLKLVLIANLISLPVAYFLMQKWLNEFAYRVNIDITLFIFSAIIAIVIAFVSISSHAIKAATSNPVKSLRYE